MQKLCIPILLFLIYYWIFRENFSKRLFSGDIKGIIVAFLVINVLSGAWVLYYDVMYDYSASKEVATYFNEISENEKILLVSGNQPEFVSAILPYLNEEIKAYSLQFDDYFTFVTWDEHILYNITEEDIENIRSKESIKSLPKDTKLYYIFVPFKNRNASDTIVIANLLNNGKISLVKKFENPLSMDEKYWVFSIN